MGRRAGPTRDPSTVASRGGRAGRRSRRRTRPATSSSAAISRRGARVLDREPHDGEHRDVLAEAGDDVADRLGRGVDREPAAGLDQVRGERRAAADDAADRLLQGVRVTGEQHADHRADGRPDRGRDDVPRGVDVGDLVRDELHREHERRDRQHLPAAQDVGDLLEVVDPVGDAEHEHDEVGVDAARPPARERQGQGLHGASLGSAATHSTSMVGAPVIAASSSYVVQKTRGRVPGGGPHDVVPLQPRVELRRHRGGVADGGDAADHLAGVLAHELRAWRAAARRRRSSPRPSRCRPGARPR